MLPPPPDTPAPGHLPPEPGPWDQAPYAPAAQEPYSPAQLASAITASQLQVEAIRTGAEGEARARSSLLAGAAAMVVAAIAGVALYVWLSRTYGWHTGEALVFALLGAAIPCGWHMTRRRSENTWFTFFFVPAHGPWLLLILLLGPFLLVVRAWISMVIGLPCAAFYAWRNISRLSRAKELRRQTEQQVHASRLPGV